MRKYIVFALTLVVFPLVASPLSAIASLSEVTLCHKPGTVAEGTIEVAEAALQAHLAHGDTEGACGAIPVNVCPFDIETSLNDGPVEVFFQITSLTQDLDVPLCQDSCRPKQFIERDTNRGW